MVPDIRNGTNCVGDRDIEFTIPRSLFRSVRVGSQNTRLSPIALSTVLQRSTSMLSPNHSL